MKFEGRQLTNLEQPNENVQANHASIENLDTVLASRLDEIRIRILRVADTLVNVDLRILVVVVEGEGSGNDVENNMDGKHHEECFDETTSFRNGTPKP
jgi:hypothetical protein